MKRVLSAGRWLHRACVFAVTVAFGVACGGSRVDDDDGGCVDVCEQQNDLCTEKQDCSAVCGFVADVTQTSGCEDEYRESLDCLDALNQCDQGMTLCPATSYKACVQAYCASHSSELFCRS